MDRYEIQKLRDLPIEGVAEQLGIQVVRHKALCPFHDDHHPSLAFSTRRNTFRCFACDAHGGTIDLVMRSLSKDFKEACEWLIPKAETPHRLPRGGEFKTETPHQLPRGGESSSTSQKASPRGGLEGVGASPRGGLEGAARFFEHPFLSPEARRFLFTERRLDERVVRWCRLTSWKDRHGTPWLQIPYYSQQGHLIGIQNRNLAYNTKSPSGNSSASHQKSPSGDLGGSIPSGNSSAPQLKSPSGDLGGSPPSGNSGGSLPPRFRFPRGSQCGIYNLPVLNRLRQDDELWITEGCSDCWAMLSAGHKAIAIPSATLLSREDKELLEGLREAERGLSFHMYPDQDAPGERLFMQLRQVLPSLVRHQLPPGCKDFSDYYLKKP